MHTGTMFIGYDTAVWLF